MSLLCSDSVSSNIFLMRILILTYNQRGYKLLSNLRERERVGGGERGREKERQEEGEREREITKDFKNN